MPKMLRCMTMASLLALTLFPMAALAEDVDPEGEKLMSLRSNPEYQAVLKEKGAPVGSVGWDIVCTAEEATVAGALVWDIRLRKDKCFDRYKKKHISAEAYCSRYSDHCDHYSWNQNCMWDKGCP